MKNNVHMHKVWAGMGAQMGIYAGLFLVLVLLLSAGTALAEVVEKPLLDADCIKCHVEPSVQIAEHGGGHRTALGCFDCHIGHPPVTEAVIPACADCHAPSAHAHYALDDCGRCHVTHAPGIEALAQVNADVPAVCFTCHQDVAVELQELPSMHADMACTDCHLRHGLAAGDFMQCMQCHEPHADTMVYADCIGCHAPHQPTDYRWSANTPVQQCAACHATEVETLARAGGAHAKDVTCSACHADHPPAETEVIPRCAQCHAPKKSAHYRVEHCAACHDPHAPMEIRLDGVSPAKPVCLSCHTGPGKEMEQHPSLHAKMDCVECHAEHGTTSSCLDCHSGHSDSMTYAQCFQCHQPHSPSYIQYKTGKVEPKLCSSCHAGAYTQIEASSTKHGALGCVFCHRRTHKVILECQSCHGQPHDAAMHRQFNDCARCHRGAHDLRK